MKSIATFAPKAKPMTKTLTISIQITVPEDLLGNAEAVMKIRPAAVAFEAAVQEAVGAAAGPLTWRQEAEAPPAAEKKPRKPRADRGRQRVHPVAVTME